MTKPIDRQRKCTFSGWRPERGHQLYDTETGEWGAFSLTDDHEPVVHMPDGSIVQYDGERFIHFKAKLRREQWDRKIAKEHERTHKPSDSEIEFLARMNGLTLEEAREAIN